MTFKKDSAIIFNLQMQNLSTEILNKCLKDAEPVGHWESHACQYVLFSFYSWHLTFPSSLGGLGICVRRPEVWGTDSPDPPLVSHSLCTQHLMVWGPTDPRTLMPKHWPSVCKAA